ncbi:MAG TPA: PEP-CTERM sorting domain-containing protein [Verrucomicrobiae bacterium]|nr:PEP-CTERM sorting domain-containing protein [Verrucomicrobiae bacterium]
MKKKKGSLKKLAAMPAVASVFALAASAANASTPVFNYTFPASWGGTGTTITDQSSAGNNGFSDGTLSLSSTVPPGAGAGTESLVTSSGGILTSATSLLNNSTVAADGGFSFNCDFMWNGTDSSSFGHTQKLIDYAGTESLQLVTTSGSAALQMQFGNDTGAESVIGTTILPNTWYNVSLDFNTEGGSLGLTGDISGIAALYVNGSLAAWENMTKGTYGDGLNRPIGVGQLGANFGYLVGFKGDIYSASVNLGAAPVPEPSTLALSLIGGIGVMGMMWKGRRRNAGS